MPPQELGIHKMTEDEDWEYFAHLARNLELELEQETEENRRMHRELKMIQKILYAYLSDEDNRKKFLTSKILVRMHQTVKKLDKRMTKTEHMHAEFLNFLRMLLHKLKKEKLVVYKTLEKTKEFQRHKGFGELL